MSKMCLYHNKRCGGGWSSSTECPHVETNDTEKCLNYEMPTEIVKLHEENRKLREAVIEERAIQKSYFMNDILDEMRDNWKYNFPTDEDKQECRDQAESELRADGVIE